MDITRRELDILRFLAAGYSGAQVANVLGINQRSVTDDLSTLWATLESEQSKQNIWRDRESRRRRDSGIDAQREEMSAC